MVNREEVDPGSEAAEVWQQILHEEGEQGNLWEVGERLEEGDKTPRSALIWNVYEEVTGEVPEELKKALIALDVRIMGADDLIDTKNMGKKEKALIDETNWFVDRFYEMKTPEPFYESSKKDRRELYQIPVEEERISARMDESEGKEMTEIAREAYEKKSEVVQEYVDLANYWLNIDGNLGEAIRSDLRSLIAKKQIVKDLSERDIEKDIRDDDLGPSAKILKHNDNQTALDLIRELYSSFEYSQASEGIYRNALETLEPGKVYDPSEASDTNDVIYQGPIGSQIPEIEGILN